MVTELEKTLNFGVLIELSQLIDPVREVKGSVAQLYSASDFGSEGWGLESLRGHNKKKSLDNLFIEAFLFVLHSRSVSHSALAFLFESGE